MKPSRADTKEWVETFRFDLLARVARGDQAMSLSAEQMNMLLTYLNDVKETDHA